MAEAIRRDLLLCAMALLAISPPEPAAADATGSADVLSYRGLLVLPEGLLAPDGIYDLGFAIYDQANGGNRLFEQALRAHVRAGIYELHLSGRPDQPLREVLSGGARYLEVAILGGGGGLPLEVLAPRQRIASVPFALIADESESVEGIAEPLPAGAIVLWDQATGCDGSPRTCPCGFDTASEFDGRMLRGVLPSEDPGVNEGAPDGTGPNGDRLTLAELPAHGHTLGSDGRHRHKLDSWSGTVIRPDGSGQSLRSGSAIGAPLHLAWSNGGGAHGHGIQPAGADGAHYHPLRSVLFCRKLAP